MKLSRSTWLNIVLIGLACASLAVVVASRDAPSSRDSEGREQNLLSAFRAADAKRLELMIDGKKVALLRDGDAEGTSTFRLVEPVKELADAATVDKFLSALADAHRLRPVEPGPAPSALGLDKPSLQVLVQTAKQTYRLALGGAAPAPSGARYVRVIVDDGAPSTVVVGKSVVEDLSINLDAFRLRSLTDVGESDVTRIDIQDPKGQVTLRRGTAGSFLLEGASAVLADRAIVKSLFFQLSRLSASQFLKESEATPALGPDAAHVELTTRDPKQTLRFDVGGNCPSDPSQLVLVRRAPDAQSACTTREIEATLRLARDDFEDRHAFSLHVDEVEELDVSSGKSKFALVRKGSGFVLHAGSEAQVELEAGNQRILALLEAEGERVENAKLRELGLEPKANSVTLRSAAARDSEVVLQVVRVGNKDPQGNLLVYREQDGVVLRLPREQARAFAIDQTLLYARKLTEFGLSSFLSAELERASGRELLRRAPNQELELVAPAGFSPDGVLSADLIQTLGALTAERFVSDRDDGSFGFGHSTLGVRFAFKNGDGSKTEHHLRFGDETALGVFATLQDDGPVFILPRAVRDTCDALLINRSVFPSSAEALNGLTLEAHGRSLRLVRQGDHFSVAPPSTLPAESSGDLLEAFANLRPEAGLHTGPARPEEGFQNPTLTVHLSPRVGPAQTLSFGAGDSWRATRVFYLRVSGVDATFVVAQSKVRALRDAL